jgi:hypothetical protein
MVAHDKATWSEASGSPELDGKWATVHGLRREVWHNVEEATTVLTGYSSRTG